MNDLINWTNRYLKSSEIHNLIIIDLFIYEFLSIHTFQDGNGRLSRLLTTLLLLQHDYLFVQYVSFENLIEISKKDYYQALMQGQKNRYKKNENIIKWTLYFLNTLNLLIQKLDNKYDFLNQKVVVLMIDKKEFNIISKLINLLKFLI